MSPPEIGFLALGIALGITAGVAFLAVVRPFAPLRPVVKVTVTPLELAPRNAAGLAARFDGPVRGSPDDDARGGPSGDAHLDTSAAARPKAPSPADPRSCVPSGPAAIPSGAVGVPSGAVGIPIMGAATQPRDPSPRRRRLSPLSSAPRP